MEKPKRLRLEGKNHFAMRYGNRKKKKKEEDVNGEEGGMEIKEETGGSYESERERNFALIMTFFSINYN